MKKSLFLSALCVVLFAANSLMAQAPQHFRASASLGMNLSQMEGDAQQGYHKIGVSVGVKGAYCFKPNFDMSAELLYNSRGCRSKYGADPINFLDRTPVLKAELNYADVALAANFHFKPSSNYTFYQQSLQIGLFYGRLLSSNLDISSNRGDSYNQSLENELQDAFRKDDIGAFVGYTWNVTKQFGIGVKHSFSLRKIYQNAGNGFENPYYRSFLPYNLSVNLVYNIFSPKLNIKSQAEKARKAKERKKRNALEEL